MTTPRPHQYTWNERDQNYRRRPVQAPPAVPLEDPPPSYDSVVGTINEEQRSANNSFPLSFPLTPLPFQVPQNSGLHPTLSVLEDKWTFSMSKITSNFGFLETTQNFCEISFPGHCSAQTWRCTKLSNSKTFKTHVPFQNPETGTSVFTFSSISYQEFRGVLVKLPCGVRLGTTQKRFESSGGKIRDFVSSRKFIVEELRSPAQPSYIIKDELSEEEFARFEERSGNGSRENKRTLVVTNGKTTPMQKTLFLG